MNVLSLFDGMSCGQIAIKQINIFIEKYYASEIKSHAIDLVKKRYPNTIHIGDVRFVSADNLDYINLLMGGSPCKGISKLNKNQEGLLHQESILFWEYIRLLKEIRKYNPEVYFLLENTLGNKKSINTITKELGVRPIKLNSSLVSAQNRVRLYWTNIPVNSIPIDLNITTKSIFTNDMPNELICTDGRVKWLNSDSGKKSINKGYTRINPYPKSGCITANGHKKWNENYIYINGKYRYLSIRELEKLQTIPEGYFDGVNYNDAYDLIGDGWTIDIISHILSHLPSKFKK